MSDRVTTALLAVVFALDAFLPALLSLLLSGCAADFGSVVNVGPSGEQHVEEIAGMNRKARRTWYAQQRALSKKGKAL
jgi:hypothetical protein